MHIFQILFFCVCVYVRARARFFCFLFFFLSQSLRDEPFNFVAVIEIHQILYLLSFASWNYTMLHLFIVYSQVFINKCQFVCLDITWGVGSSLGT